MALPERTEEEKIEIVGLIAQEVKQVRTATIIEG